MTNRTTTSSYSATVNWHPERACEPPSLPSLWTLSTNPCQHDWGESITLKFCFLEIKTLYWIRIRLQHSSVPRYRRIMWLKHHILPKTESPCNNIVSWPKYLALMSGIWLTVTRVVKMLDRNASASICQLQPFVFGQIALFYPKK